ncbi:AMP-binding protein [Nocardia brasiliensis]|uniref:AMP-binding protein n=1 Tax=Nocardia brasiliensis TaxID=37326 RepID=UPI002453B424|nr:AMP-binding protein [Nocardia brasiliensis]
MRTPTLVDLIHHRALVTPTAIAIETPQRVVSYEELMGTVEAVAAGLHCATGYHPGNLIGICMRDSGDAIIAMLAVMLAGEIYVPISASWPPDRAAAIVGAVSPTMIITDVESDWSHITGSCPVVEYHDLPERGRRASAGTRTVPSTSNPVAYVMFTSGSSGVPKGVAISHANLLSTYRAWHESYRLDKLDSHLQVADLGFDVFAGDWIRALCSGARLHLYSAKRYDGAELVSQLNDDRIQCAEFTPASIRSILSYCRISGARLPHLRLLISGSDMLSAAEFRALHRLVDRRCRVVNSYGATETSIDNAFFDTTGDRTHLPSEQPVPIGAPLANTRLMVIADNGSEVAAHPVEAAHNERAGNGELLIGGPCVGLGYLDHTPDIAHRYLRRTPLGAPARWFRSGDLAHLAGDGTITLLGRLDAHAKHDGRALDLTTVEAAVRRLPHIEDCLATTTTPGPDQRIVLLVIAVPDSSDSHEVIRDIAADTLGLDRERIVVRVVPIIPLTANGKYDRRAVRRQLADHGVLA